MFPKTNLLVILLLCNYTRAQQRHTKLPDSLTSKSFEYLSESIVTAPNDSVKRLVYAQAWLAKAKTKQDYAQMVHAYKAMIYNGSKKERLVYADSMIIMAKRATSKAVIGAAYMTKGIIHYDRKEHTKALDNYLIADAYISQTTDSYNAYKIKYGIAHAKYYLGLYNEAIEIFKLCLEYFRHENDRAYLNTLHSLSLCYNKLGNYKLSSQTNQLGLRAGLELENTEMTPYFNHSEGINQYYLHHYNQAINKLQNTLPTLSANKDFANEAVAYFYIGRSYWSLQKREKAISYFKKVDSAFIKHNYTRPDLREAYELLIEYYVQQKDMPLQLLYINKLLKIDQELHSNYKYISGKIHKEYDTRKLLQAKKDIEEALQFNKAASIAVICLMTLIIMFMVRKHYRNKKLFEELMNRTTGNDAPVLTSSRSEMDLDINPELVKAILKNLEKFERNKKYLQKEMTLMRVASILNTNSKYVSKIIAHHRHKKFTEYINDLKTDHIIELLKKENKYRNYTNKALGEEAGFGSTQNFTRAFNNRTGISPTYFISQLNKLKVAEYENRPS